MGLLRLFLALSVVAGHSGTAILGFRGIGAFYAVNFFFIISGFYMAMVLTEKYKTTSPVLFYKSRILRLFPTYYIGLLLSIAVSYQAIFDFFRTLELPGKLFFIFQNAFIFGQDLSYLVCVKTIVGECANPVSMTLNPPAWSLAVELGFYLLAPFMVKSVKKTFIFVLIGCAYLLSINVLQFPLDPVPYLRIGDIYMFNYYFYPASFIFFGGGALAYHLSRPTAQPRYFVGVAALIALSFSQTVMPFWHLLFFGMAIPVLFRYTERNRFDRQIGELSYPLYILHFPILLLIRPLVGKYPTFFQYISLGTWVAVISAMLGLIIYMVIEKRINAYRASKVFFKETKQAIRKAEAKFSYGLIAAYAALPLAVIGYVHANQVTPAPTTAFNLTDPNWNRGISRDAPGFFVAASAENLRFFRAGSTVKFANGESRSIVSAIQAGAYLNVYVDGAPLAGEAVGYPKLIIIKR
jgi:peptidoglycan/LPS O-acetylase OafA/YrhL